MSKTVKEIKDDIKEITGGIPEKLSELKNLASKKDDNKEKQEYLNQLAHDIRNEMTIVSHLATVALDNPEDTEKLKGTLSDIREIAEKLSFIMNDIIDYTEVLADNITTDINEFNICSLIENGIDSIEQAAGARNITVSTDTTKVKHKYVYGAEAGLTRAIINIVANGIRYNKDGGYMNVAVKEDEITDDKSIYTITISDNGIGMTPEVLANIFNPFSMELSRSRLKNGGTGMGLVLVKSILDRIGGEIKVESIEGLGSKVTVKLELKTLTDAAGSKIEVSEIDDEKLIGLKALLVDDSRLNSEVGCYILEMEGIITNVANSGADAIRLFEESRENEYDFILMDIIMPEMDGYETTKKIRSLKREDAKKIPIVALSANAYEQSKEDALAAGMDGYITKPLDEKHLFTLLTKLL